MEIGVRAVTKMTGTAKEKNSRETRSRKTFLRVGERSIVIA